MNKKEIKIQQLIHQSNYQKFLLNKVTINYFGLISISSAVAIPFIITSDNLIIKFLTAIIYVTVVVFSSKHFDKKNPIVNQELKRLSNEIHNLYKEILK